MDFQYQRREDGFVFPNGARIEIFKGDLAEVMADVIVNSTGREMSLSLGNVAPALLKKAGNKLQEECNRLKPIEDGEVSPTNGYNLPCHKVLHVCCPSWQGESTEKVLRGTIIRCLKFASDQGFKSIAFPVLGTGVLDYPRDKVARCFIEAAANFDKSNPNSSVKKIFIVVFTNDKSTIDMFERALRIKIDYQIQKTDEDDPEHIEKVTTLPSTWEEPKDKYEEFRVEKGSVEWKKIEANFGRIIGSHKVKILEVRRVQNPKAYYQYESMKESVAGELGETEEEVEVEHLWHGSSEANIHKIVRSHFDRGLKGLKVRNALGAGVYFSTTSSYSSNEVFSPPNAAGEKFMIQARVVCGDYCKGEKSMMQSPYKLGSDFRQFNSVVDDVSNPIMYEVFHDDSAYPEYIIRYKLIN